MMLLYAAYDRPLPDDPLAQNLKINAWKVALEPIPSDRLHQLVHDEIQNRTSEYAPTPADLLRRWKAATECPDMANSAAYATLEPTGNQLAERSTVQPQTECGREEFLRLGERMRRDLNLPPQPQPYSYISDERKAPEGSAELVQALYHWLRMNTARVPRELREAFGWWLLKRFPVEEWTPELGRQQWDVWIEEEGALNY
jgi:hypothetical protein